MKADSMVDSKDMLQADQLADVKAEKSADESEPSRVASSVEKKVAITVEMSVATKEERESTTVARSAVPKVGSWVFLTAAMLAELKVSTSVGQ